MSACIFSLALSLSLYLFSLFLCCPLLLTLFFSHLHPFPFHQFTNTRTQPLFYFSLSNYLFLCLTCVNVPLSLPIYVCLVSFVCHFLPPNPNISCFSVFSLMFFSIFPPPPQKKKKKKKKKKQQQQQQKTLFFLTAVCNLANPSVSHLSFLFSSHIISPFSMKNCK